MAPHPQMMSPRKSRPVVATRTYTDPDVFMQTTSVCLSWTLCHVPIDTVSFRPPPVLEMPATFNLELNPGQTVALDTLITSDELDMARMEDGTTVDGSFWGKLDIVHQGDTHTMEFSGTRIANSEDVSPDLMVDARVINKLAVAAKPPTAKCHLTILAPVQQYCDVTLSFSNFWKLGITWPQAEPVSDNKVKYFLRVHPGGAVEHFESEMTATSLYYEAMSV